MKKKYVITIIIVFILVVIAFSVGTYAYWRYEKTQVNNNIVATECFDLSFSEEVSSGINLVHAYPISDEEANDIKPYQVHITNHCDNDLTYQMNLEILKNTTLKEEYVKIRVNEEESDLLNAFSVGITNVKDSIKAYEIKSGVIEASSTLDLGIRIWLNGDLTMEDTEAMNKEFYSKVSIYGSYNNYRGRYTEDILNGADPVLKDGLIPVTIENQNGENIVRKADTTTKWYSYQDKQWANAVILENEETEYQNGEEIPESNIESYFVWIPRYRYQIFNDGLYSGLSNIDNSVPKEIKIEFENKDKRASDGVRKGQWLTHPAFTSFDVNGIWVGKFETGYKGATSGDYSQQNEFNVEKVQIKPNLYYWRGIQVGNAHLNSFNYKREYDSHMMKNTEWGAVAYLSHSKYGTCTDGICKEIRSNNHYDFTGYAAVHAPTTGYTTTNESCSKTPNACNESGISYEITRPWNDESVLGLASTTGNISGIYDMAGGVWEYVMGVMTDKQGIPVSGVADIYNSNFVGTLTNPSVGENTSKDKWTKTDGGIDWPDSKYYDVYPYNENDQNFERRILGDAIGEMGPFGEAVYGSQTRHIGSWYQDESFFINYGVTWIARGGGYTAGVNSGIFDFYAADGSASYGDYRIVLAF